MAADTIDSHAAGVRSGATSALAAVEDALQRIAAGNDTIRGFVHVDAADARAQARALDARREAGERLGPLAGVPVGLKDAICSVDQPTTAASRILGAGSDRPYRPAYDATVVARLRAADAVLLGKCNMDEFAMGSSTEHGAYGPTHNPWDATRTAGGSSGGSAAVVAADFVPCALGSDTGGSVRQPAAMTGVVGVKPSYGRVSRYGLIAFASSLDQIGPLTRDVRSAAHVLEAIAGPDPRDATSLDAPVGALRAACDRGVAGMRLGIPDAYFQDGLDAEVERRVREAIAALEEAGATITEVSMPHTRHAVAAYYVVATAEASSNLARFDGVRFGIRGDDDGDLTTMYESARSRGFGDEVKRRIMLGTYVLSAGYFEAYYRRAQRVRTLIRRDFDRAFSEVDALITPVSPTTAFTLGSRTTPLSMYLADIYTLPASLAGVAAMSVPAGLGEASKLPVGLQVVAPSGGEAAMFQVAAAWEALAPDQEARPLAPTREATP